MPWEVRALVPRSFETFVTATDLPEGGWVPRYVVRSEQGVMVSDELSRRVLLLDEQGRYQHGLGDGVGDGPGELRSPRVLRLGPEGEVWVLDQAQGRLSSFSKHGDLLSSVNTSGGSFSVLRDGSLILPPGLGSGSSPVTLDDGEFVSLPVELSSSSEDSALLRLVPASAWVVCSDHNDRVLILNNFNGAAWFVERDGGRWEASRVVVPEPITALARAKSEGRREALGLPNVVVPLFRDVQVLSDGKVWIHAGWSEMLGAWIDFDRRSITAVLPSDRQEHALLLAVVPFGTDQLVAFYDDGARVLTLTDTEPPPWLVD